MHCSATWPWSSTTIWFDLVEPVGLVGDEQDGAAFGGLQQVGGQRLVGVWVQVGGGFVEDQQRRVNKKRAGQREALPFAAGTASPWVPTGVSQPWGSDLIQGSSRARGGGLDLLVGSGGAGEPQVVADGGVEQVGVLRASADADRMSSAA